MGTTSILASVAQHTDAFSLHMWLNLRRNKEPFQRCKTAKRYNRPNTNFFTSSVKFSYIYRELHVRLLEMVCVGIL